MGFEDEPEGDPHGECAAEIHKLKAEVEKWKSSYKETLDTLGKRVGEGNLMWGQVQELKLQVSKLLEHLKRSVEAGGKIHPSAKHHPIGDEVWKEAVMSYSDARDYLASVHNTNVVTPKAVDVESIEGICTECGSNLKKDGLPHTDFYGKLCEKKA